MSRVPSGPPWWRRLRGAATVLCLLLAYAALLRSGMTPAIVWFLSPDSTAAASTEMTGDFARLATSAAASLTPVTTGLTPVPDSPLPLTMSTRWTDFAIESIAIQDKAFWQGTQIPHEGACWLVVTFTWTNRRTTRPDTLSGDELGLIVDEAYEVSIHRNATGGVGLQEGIGATPAGAAGLDMGPGESVRSLVVFDVPPTFTTLQFRYRTLVCTLPLAG